MAAIAFINWQTMLLKYGIVDKEEIKAMLDVIKQKPKERVQGYYDIMEKLFTRGKIENAKHRKRIFLSSILRLENFV
jgi:intergrase/recombinase